MTGPSMRDRFFTRPVAGALTAPSSILLAGAGAAAGILAGLPLAAAAGVGAVAWGVRVAVAMPRRRSTDGVDPFRLQDPWRTFVWEARRSQRRFHDATHRARKGPLRERLDTIGGRIDTAVLECWRIAQAGHALSDARAAVDVAALTTELSSLTASGQPDPASRLHRTVQALQAQLATAQRLEVTIADTVDRLRLLDARLGEAVTRAIELAARAQGVDDLTALDDDVDDLVGEMEALRQALDETAPGAPVAGTASAPAGAAAPTTAPAPPDPRIADDRGEPGQAQPSPG